MKAKPDLKTIFGIYAGQTLKSPSRVTCDLDFVYEEMRSDAQDNGLELRVIFPDKATDFGHNPNRANVFVEKDPAGRYRVTDKFTYG